MHISKKSVKFSFEFPDARITPTSIQGCGGYALHDLRIPVTGFNMSMDGDTFDGLATGVLSFNMLDMDDALEELAIVGTDSHFRKEYSRREKELESGGADEDTVIRELNRFEETYPSWETVMEGLCVDIKSAKINKFNITGKWSSWEDAPEIDEWKEGIKGHLLVDITDGQGNRYRDVKIKFTEYDAFEFGEDIYSYMYSAVETANERDDYMATMRKSKSFEQILFEMRNKR